MSSHETQKNDDENFKERFRLACKAEPLSVEFAKTCSSAVALLARTVSTFQMVNEIYTVLGEDQENMKTPAELEALAKELMPLFAGMQSSQVIAVLARLGASCAFTEYMARLKIEQSKH